MNDERHENQHRIIDERVAAFKAYPKRSGIQKSLRREAEKRAWFTLRSHLQSPHGLRPNKLGHDPLGPFISLDEMIERHNKLHQQ